MGIYFFGSPLWNVVSASAWKETPCLVTSSEVKTSVGSKGRAHARVKILYVYRVSGTEYSASCYSFMNGFPLKFEKGREIVSHYPVGKEARCYVNPSNPSASVINRGLSSFSAGAWIAFAGCTVAVLFCLLGLYGPLRFLLRGMA